MTNPFLVGIHVYLRPLELSNAATALPWLNDPECTQWLRLYRPMTLVAEEKFLKQTADDDTMVRLLIARKEDDAPLGLCSLQGIDARNRDAEFGIMIGAKTTWGRGYGTEATRLLMAYAFETMNLNRVHLFVNAHNERALRSYARIGFQREGVLRQAYYRKGKYEDGVLMSLLRAEWEATRP
jgi:RimJ/RimL family protein N-acetyltransferase